jgi:hypothetical protein
MTMKLIDMTIADDFVRMSYATDANKNDSEQWIEFKVPVKDASSRPVGEVQMQAILQVRAAFDEQMEQIRAEPPPRSTGGMANAATAAPLDR